MTQPIIDLLQGTILLAIEAGEILAIEYGDRVRIVEPYVYGRDRRGAVKLRAFELDTVSEAGSAGQWKLYNGAKIGQIQLTKTDFTTARDGYTMGLDSVITKPSKSYKEIETDMILPTCTMKDPEGGLIVVNQSARADFEAKGFKFVKNRPLGVEEPPPLTPQEQAKVQADTDAMNAPAPPPDATAGAINRAKDLGIDLADVLGTGTGGRIIASDVTNAAEAAEQGENSD